MICRTIESEQKDDKLMQEGVMSPNRAFFVNIVAHYCGGGMQLPRASQVETTWDPALFNFDTVWDYDSDIVT